MRFFCVFAIVVSSIAAGSSAADNLPKAGTTYSAQTRGLEVKGVLDLDVLFSSAHRSTVIGQDSGRVYSLECTISVSKPDGPCDRYNGSVVSGALVTHFSTQIEGDVPSHPTVMALLKDGGDATLAIAPNVPFFPLEAGKTVSWVQRWNNGALYLRTVEQRYCVTQMVANLGTRELWEFKETSRNLANEDNLPTGSGRHLYDPKIGLVVESRTILEQRKPPLHILRSVTQITLP